MSTEEPPYESRKIIGWVRSMNVELEVRKTVYPPNSEDLEPGPEVIDFLIHTDEPSCQQWLTLEDLPDLIYALGRMVHVLRRNDGGRDLSTLVLGPLFAAVDDLPDRIGRNTED